MTAPSIKEALEPCPFCGDSELNFTNLSADATQQFVFCESCHGRSGAGNGREEATQRWNTRALTASPGEQEPVAAAGWNEAIEAAMTAIENMRVKGAANLVDARHQGQRGCDYTDTLYDAYQAVKALRREAPAPEGAEDTIIPDSSDMDARFAWLEAKATDMGYVLVPEPEHPDSPHRPDAGGGER